MDICSVPICPVQCNYCDDNPAFTWTPGSVRVECFCGAAGPWICERTSSGMDQAAAAWNAMNPKLPWWRWDYLGWPIELEEGRFLFNLFRLVFQNFKKLWKLWHSSSSAGEDPVSTDEGEGACPDGGRAEPSDDDQTAKGEAEQGGTKDG